MDTKTKQTITSYDTDKIDDILCELEDSKVKVNVLMDYNLKLRRLNRQQNDKNLLSYEQDRLSPITEILNNEIFEAIDKAMKLLSSGQVK